MPSYEGPRFILFDGRAAYDIDAAAVMDTAASFEEANKSGMTDWDGHDAIWFDQKRDCLRYDIAPAKKGNKQ